MSRIRANLIANIGGSSSLALVQLVCVPLYVKLLGVETYGLIGFFATLQASLKILDLGISQTLNRQLARLSVQTEKAGEMRNFVRTVEAAYWLVGILAGAGVCMAAPAIAQHWINVGNMSVSLVQHAVVLMGVIILVQWPLSLYQGGLMGLQRQVLLNAVRISAALLGGAGTLVILWFFSRTVTAFFACQIAVGVIQMVWMGISLWYALPKSDMPARITVDAVRESLPFARGMSGIAIAGMALSQMDKVVLSKLLPLTSFGYYSLASLIASSLQLFIVPVFSAIFPRLSSLAMGTDVRAVSRLYHDGTQLMVVLVVPVAAVLALFAPQVIGLWTGNAMIARHTALIAAFLVLGTAINGIMFMPYALQLAYGWTSISMWLTVGLCAVLAPLIYVIAVHYGAAGAAAVWLFVNILNLCVSLPLTHRRLLRHEGRQWLITDVGLPALAAFAVASAAQRMVSLPVVKGEQAAILAAVLVVTMVASASMAPRPRQWLAQIVGGRPNFHSP